MATAFSRGSSRRNGNGAGFSLIEAMVSIAILGLLSVIVVVDLRATKRREELTAAARLIAGDVRGLQTRAFTAQNLKTCPSGPVSVVCENPGVACGGPCAPAPPFDFGAHFTKGGATYALFADVDSSNKDWMETPSGGETFSTRDLAKDGAVNVTIDDLIVGAATSKADAQVAFERQNGRMHVNPCASAPCVEETTLTIRLKHAQSGETRTVALNAVTGRVSIE